MHFPHCHLSRNVVYYNQVKGKELIIMMKATIDFGKPYEKQTEEVKMLICREDFYQVANLLGFKKRVKEFKKRG